jgi:hypothetical protein
MAWDSSKPPASGYLQSAELRANWSAIETQALGTNLFGDPDFGIWAAGSTSNPPSWWNRTTGCAVGGATQTTEATSSGSRRGRGGILMAKMTYQSAKGRLYQNVLSSGDMPSTSHVAMGLRKITNNAVSIGAWVYTNSNDCKLMLSDGGTTSLSSAITAGSWQWWTHTMALTTAMAMLRGGVQINASGYAYVGFPTMVLGPIPPKAPIPCPVSRGTIGIQLAGDPVARTTSPNGIFEYRHNLPWRVDRVDVSCLSAISSGTFTLTIKHYDGTSRREMFTTSARPQAAAAHFSGTPNKFRDRCFDATTGAADLTDSLMSLFVASTNGHGGGKNPTIMIRTVTYQPPLISLRQGRNGVSGYK